ncbi:MAG: hypothetical protein P4K80_00585 [Acidobacteriaceae bacterium]|nr:hypothetical protein [Acidobacteriaceae bacterium]
MLTILSRMIRTGILTEPRTEQNPALSPESGSRPRTAAPLNEDAATVEALQRELWKTLGRALCIRHVDAGSCNGCELEINAINNPYYNLEGMGIKFVASPRHADLLLVTGPVSVNMEEALRRTYDAMPNPKLVVALGDCGACGGIFGKNYASRGGISSILPVDQTIAGCPPSPAAIITGILQAISSAAR